MDRKKEHSRHLAQRRRNLENLEYENLSRVLPVHQAISGSLLNKTKILRLAANYLKLKALLHSSLPENATCMPENRCNEREEKQYDTTRNSLLSCAKLYESGFQFFEPTIKILDVIDGFLFCLDEAATVLYASETISIGFGLSQTVELNIVPMLRSDNSENSQLVGFAGIAIPLLFQMQLSPSLNSRSFVMMTDLDLTIRYMCDEYVFAIFGKEIKIPF
ncbi:Helix-loop-helix 34 [Trichinella pseudospiralis]|uniref:Helix-loop-helix 34 n=2 Tax=Trichinella pseudospiralis TaxID=6337 RepID=A0A0V1J9A9_TRIPS|nr:Helix-loop-helix 34 [Trichinella pseudospiralis]KRZ43143.1 Helix-loop-helix 34 [Trichinella pseudospiralis]